METKVQYILPEVVRLALSDYYHSSCHTLTDFLTAIEWTWKTAQTEVKGV